MPHFHDDLGAESPEFLHSLRVMFHGRNRPVTSAPSPEARFGVATPQAVEEPVPVAASDATDPAPRAELHAS